MPSPTRCSETEPELAADETVEPVSDDGQDEKERDGEDDANHNSSSPDVPGGFAISICGGACSNGSGSRGTRRKLSQPRREAECAATRKTLSVGKDRLAGQEWDDLWLREC